MSQSNLVIVESPTKIKSLTHYLGKSFNVISSKGHIIDLPKSELGIDITHHYKPEYTLMKGKESVINSLKKAAKNADTIYLATDLDREGEAIAWHIVSVLDGLNTQNKVKDAKKFKRVVFAEITKDTILAAFKNPRGFNYNLINAYQARRVLDRLVGYKLSPLLWKKIQYGLSAGRVQSVAVRLIVEREQERKNFEQKTYYHIYAQAKSNNQSFETRLNKINGKKVDNKHKIQLFAGDYTYSDTIINSKTQLTKTLAELKPVQKLKVIQVKERNVSKNPDSPFTTASLQRASLTYLHVSAKQTMSLAQRLYEEGHITYHRTDSIKLSHKFLDAARKHILAEFGSKYLPKQARIYKRKQKGAQEAHEAIRPTHVDKLKIQTQRIKKKLGSKEARLYELIWKRALASQAASAVYGNVTITLNPNVKLAHEYSFVAHGSVIIFDGYLKITGKRKDDTILPKLKENQLVPIKEFTSSEHLTSPPPRYNEASLVKDLEVHEIGRPSTYAPIIDTIQNRNYVLKENGTFVSEDIGMVVNQLLVDNFPEIVDLQFTAEMEDKLDEVANGKLSWVKEVDDFYKPFEKKLEKSEKNLTRDDYKILEKLKEKCPDCKHNLILKLGKFGKFYSCSNFPDCKFAKPFIEKIGMKCPDCKDGDLIIRRTKRGKRFFGCTNYPKCSWASWTDPRQKKDKI